MSVRVRKISDSSLFSFSCAQWALMEDIDKADWEVVENLCGRVTLINNPYAASEFFYTLDGQVAAETPLRISTVDGISTILFENQPQKTVLAGPVSGADDYPTFRLLELTDLPDLTETIQDGIGTILADTDTVNFTYNDATPSIIADVRMQMSITSDASGVKLSGDAATPGANKVYGTDAGGVKGWKDDPAGGSLSDGDKGDITVSGGGTVWEIDAGVVGTTELADLNVTTGKLADGAVTTVKITDLNVTTGKLVDGAVTTVKITDLNVTTGKLADNAVTTVKITDLNVTTGKLADNAVTTVKITDLNVTTAKIADNAVTDAKLRTGTAASVIGRSAATGGNVADIVSSANHQVLKRDDTGALIWGLNTTDNIADNAITTAKINNNAVTDAKLRQGVARSIIGVTGNATANVADIQGTTDQVLRVDSAGTALGFGQVATGGIANDAVTYAKIQNVSATNRVLGRIAAGAGDVQELSNTDLYTIMGLTGTANRFALWTGPNTLTSDAAFTFDAVNDRMTITGTVAGLGANNAFLNINSGAIAGATEFLRLSGNITNNLLAVISNANNAAATSNTILQILTGGSVGGDPTIQFTVSGAVTHAMGVDNSDSDKIKITPTATTPGGVANCGIIITNATSPRVGINKDAPAHALDVAGVTQAHQFRNHTNAWIAGNVVFGTGAGTGPTLNEIVGGVNGLRVRFTTGTAPTNNGDIFTATYPTSFGGESYVTIAGRTTTAVNAEFSKFYISAAGANSFTLKANGTLTASTEYHIQFTIFGITLG